MSTTKFTPGPWQGCAHLRADADKTCGCGYRGGIWSKSADVMVCELGAPNRDVGDDMIPRSERPMQIADHWLIAAAPDLYAALQLALKEAENWIHDQLDGTSMVEDALAELEPCRVALRKARGEDA